MKKIKEMLPYLTATAISYFIFLSILLLNGDMEIGKIIFLIVIPVLCLLFSIAYGKNHSLNVFYAVFVAILFMPTMLILSEPLWLFGIVYGIVALIGNVVGMMLHKHNAGVHHGGKIGRNLIRAVFCCYIVALFISAIMLIKMNRITYRSTAYGLTICEMNIDFTSNSATRSYFDFDGELHDYEENSISRLKEFQIKAVCAISLMPIWQVSYHNPWVMDGDKYNITRGYESRESIVYGSNAYPLTYGLVYWVIFDAIE